MVITLIGYRGTGKSTVGSALGERLGWNWIDADDQIESVAGRTIAEIFAETGEPGFRRLERETISRLLAGDEHLVLAAGGGAILNMQTRREMQQAGPVIWLTASVETILARLKQDETTAERRPNLTAGGGRAEVEQLLAQREPLYRETAGVCIDTEQSTVEQIVAEILSWLPSDLREGAAG
jgi:shikimate kinase